VTHANLSPSIVSGCQEAEKQRTEAIKAIFLRARVANISKIHKMARE
jgi:hypothetical protein